jgi:hypothetical protein
MATTFLNPDGSSSVNGWSTSYSTTASHLSQGDTSNEWRTIFNNTGKVIFTLDDFDFSGLNVSSITNIKHQLIIGLDARGGSANVIVAIRNAAGSTLYSETHSNTAGAGFQTFTGTARTTSDGSSAWTDGDLDGLGMFLTCTGGPFVHIVQQLYIEVTYVEVSGYSHDIIGLGSSNISKINALATANVGKVIGRD